MMDSKMPKIIVLVHDKCPHCDALKEKIGNDENFKVMDVSNDLEAKRLASRLGVKAVPYFLYSDERGKVCTLTEKGKVGKCVTEIVGNGKRKR